MLRKILIYFILCSLSFSATYKVALLCPRESIFWSSVAMYAKSTAEDLDMDLIVYYADDNYLNFYQEAKRLMEEEGIDAIIFNNFKNQGSRIIKLAEEFGVKAILFNSPMSNEDKKKMGDARELYDNWIYEIYPNELKASEELFMAIEKKTGSIFDFIALNGQKLTGAAIIRELGIEEFLTNNKDAKLLYHTNINNWDRVESELKFSQIYDRYSGNNLKLIWTGSQNILKGVFDYTSKNEIDFGEYLFATTYNFDPEIFDYIKEGKVIATVGGHEVDGAFSLLILYDFFMNKEYISNNYTVFTNMVIVTEENIELFIDKLYRDPITYERLKAIDFSRFTLSKSGKETYDFNMENILKELERVEGN